MRKWATLILIFLMWPGPNTVSGAVNDPALGQLQESINQAVAVVRPSVVSIKAQKKKRTDATGQGFIWYESIGSGFLIDERGFILTNYHVAGGAESITVTLWRSQQSEFFARVVHADKSLDLMVLKIDSNERFSPATLGDSDRIETGDWGISVGSPFGFEHSASLGIVSDLHRDLMIGRTSYKNMIQTDAVINEGNSGGPFIDINGRVVGIATAIYAPAGTYTGVGFAIPINRAKHFFTHVTGAVKAALTVAAGPAKEPINLNKNMPNDATHKKFADCTTCHTITQKMVISQKAGMSHPMVGACDKCHITEKGPVNKGPITVAATRPVATPPDSNQGVGGPFYGIILKLALIVLVSSIVFTMLGVGGGFMYVPILLTCGIDFHTAATTSLLMLATAQISASYVFFRSGLVDLKLIMILELPTMIGAFAGGLFSDHFNVALLAIMFSCTLFLASYFMLQDDMQPAGPGGSVSTSPWNWHGEFRGHAYSVDMMVAFPLTFGIGFMGGLLGLAGGWLKVPMMVVMFGIPMKVAVATSSLMVPITGFAGFLGHSVLGHFDPRLALPLCVLAVAGAQIGSRLSIKTDSSLLRFIFAFVLGVVGLWMLLRVFF
ncbi:MAG: TSUP family transporter [Deltaproteobacteria bacterium]|nr:TSUP family transporter [Deltaproteobacteria bacterium]